MIELRTLGVLDLRDGNGNEIRSVLQQPKRLALLAYLALASPRRHHRRESLLAMFWPELDEEHARAALRRSLYYLRTGLGREVIAARGEDELTVSAEGLWCDATAFSTRRAERLWREAGPEALLEGRILPEDHFQFRGGRARGASWYVTPERLSDPTPAEIGQA
jgi:DNA-binding SARP family transcriptional activator